MENEQDLVAHAEEIITACCKIKRDVVEEDELDLGLRLILNFGHTIGHALENTAGYGVIAHGEGVSLGMIQITQVAEQQGLSPWDYPRVGHHARKVPFTSNHRSLVRRTSLSSNYMIKTRGDRLKSLS